MWYYWAVVVVMFTGGFASAYVSLAPFGVGLATWALALGMSLAVMVSTHEYVSHTGSERFVRAVRAVAFWAGMILVVALAVVRAEVFAFHLKAAVLNTEASNLTGDGAAFYLRAVPLLGVVFALLALAIDISGGLAFHSALVPSRTLHERAQLREELNSIGNQKIEIMQRLVETQNIPRGREAAIMREFYRGLMDAAEGISRAVSVLCLLLALSQIPSFAQPLVVEVVDFSASETSPGPDGKSDFDKSFDGLARTIEQLPPGAEVIDLGITAESFSRPWVLLSRRIPSDKGPLQFLDQIALAKERMRADIGDCGSMRGPTRRAPIFSAC